MNQANFVTEATPYPRIGGKIPPEQGPVVSVVLVAIAEQIERSRTRSAPFKHGAKPAAESPPRVETYD